MRGRGECVPYARYGETLESVTEQIEGLPERIDRAALAGRAAGGRGAQCGGLCACGIWRPSGTGKRVWELAGLAAPAPMITAYTLSLDTAREDAGAAARHAHRPLAEDQAGHAR